MRTDLQASKFQKEINGKKIMTIRKPVGRVAASL
jgi:hypothetical protein